MSMLCQPSILPAHFSMDQGYYPATTPWSQYHLPPPQQSQQSRQSQQQQLQNSFQSLPPRLASNDKMKLSFLLNSDKEEPTANIPRPDHLILHNTIKSQYLPQVSLITGYDTPLMSGSNVSAAMMASPAAPAPVHLSYAPCVMPTTAIQQHLQQPQYPPHQQQPLPLGHAPSLSTTNHQSSLGESGNSHSLTQSPNSLCNQSNKHFWTKQEDELLVQLVEKHGPKNWDRMATMHLSHRNGSQLRARWLYNLSKDCAAPSREFTQDEDKFILSFYAKHGGSWSRMAKELGSGHNDQEVKNRFRKLERMLRAQRAHEIGSEALEFSVQDDALIMEFVSKNGSRWTELSKLLNDRTADEVKNRYRKLERRKKAAEASGEA